MKKAILGLLVLVTAAACSEKAGDPAKDGMTPQKNTVRWELCHGNEERTDLRDPNVENTPNGGYNPNFYYTVSASAEAVDLGDLNTMMFSNWRERVQRGIEKKMREKLRADVAAHPERWTFQSGLRDSLDNWPEDQRWPVAESGIELFEQRGVINCKANEYRYYAKAAVPLNPLSTMPELDAAVSKGLTATMDRALAPLLKGNVTLDVPGSVIEELRAAINRSDIRRLAGQYQAQLRYVDDDTRLLIDWLQGERVNVAPFRSAEYTLGGDMIVVLSVLTQSFLRIAEVGATYEIVVVGRADSRPLSPRPYFGAAVVSLKPGERRPLDSGPETGLTLSDNQQLSVARGFQAAQHLQREIQNHGGANVQIIYGGDGVVAGGAADSNRRVEITLRKISK